MELQKDYTVLSGYHTIAVLNEAHRVFLVQQQDTHRIYVKKQLEVYNPAVYRCLQQNPVPGIPKILECHEEQGRLTVIEEYISGDSLEEKLRSGRITEPEMLQWLTELCEILDRLHRLQPPIIHRDIKPSNVMITNGDHVVLLDFNAAKQYHGASASDTVLLGTQGYAAPEQYGFGASSPQTDIYALGVLMREMLEKLPTADIRLAEIADRCTRLSPEARYQNVQELQRALTAAADPAAAGRSVTETESSFLPPGFRTRTPWKMFLAGVVYLFLLWLSLTLEIKDLTGGVVWLERFTCLSMNLAVIAGTCNYRNIQRLVPLCRRESWVLRCLGILILDLVMVTALFTLMMILESAVFHV